MVWPIGGIGFLWHADGNTLSPVDDAQIDSCLENKKIFFHRLQHTFQQSFMVTQTKSIPHRTIAPMTANTIIFNITSVTRAMNSAFSGFICSKPVFSFCKYKKPNQSNQWQCTQHQHQWHTQSKTQPILQVLLFASFLKERIFFFNQTTTIGNCYMSNKQWD